MGKIQVPDCPSSYDPHLRLAGDAINAAPGGNALSHAAANRRQADGEAGTDGGEGRDPDRAIGRVGGLELLELEDLRLVRA
jgi:hypothetical protein